MNNVQLIGNLTKDIELRKTQSGKSVVNFTLAVSRTFNREETDFIQCQAWEKTADTIAEYCRKGSKLGITGEIRTGSYEKNGQTVYTTTVIVSHFEFLTPRANKDNGFYPFGENTNEHKSEPKNTPLYGETLTQQAEKTDYLGGIGEDDLPF